MRLTPLAPAQWDDSLKDVVDAMKGAPLNVHGLMAHNPDLLRAWWSFRNHSVAGGTLGKRWAEIVILRVAARLKAWYEFGSHTDRGLKAGLTLEEIERIRKEPAAAHWAPAELALISAADELVDNRQLSQTVLTQLSDHFTPAQILDLMAIHGMYVTLAYMINTWSLELDAAVAQRIPKELTQERFFDDTGA